MELIRGLANLKSRHSGCALTIGNFDGVHLGHQALLDQAREIAQGLGLPSAVMSFDPTPREYFARDEAPPRVATLRDKLAQIQDRGIDRLLLVRFCRRFASQSPQAFVEELLIRRLGVRALVVGDDFRFGRGRAGNLELLGKLGTEHGMIVETLGSVDVDGLRCSSTAVRGALGAADLAAAAKLLGRPYSIRGVVRHGRKLGRALGVPTANIAFKKRMALRYGVYAVRVQQANRQWTGVANFGVRPTLGGEQRLLLEVHAFADTGELYGRQLRVEFSRFLRPEQRFDSLDALKTQIRLDADAARDHFSIA
ncbi:bifunctional riboflavin kinase/FAD synthetase [Algiphilus sp. W345]|uniref:Riboflavin biosynthesis protein n=1 Tax=Banduia mediterranea TaxID=3075609 RepID=A0ABU2WFN3_9GAMM|nr:bifunctional riboflavin kinase/FAD synthetase [Algiphilus sp. W345]MDT0496318.1 bifunctional riboflavin kinase/FAD synthetase [Algiphilus sp. W345]